MKMVQLPNGQLSSRIFRLWRGDLPDWVALVIVYPMTIAGMFWLNSWIKDLSNHAYSDWEYATRKAIAQNIANFSARDRICRDFAVFQSQRQEGATTRTMAASIGRPDRSTISDTSGVWRRFSSRRRDYQFGEGSARERL